MSNDFLNQLASVSKSREDVEAQKSDMLEIAAINEAYTEYEKLKKEILNYAKNVGHVSNENHKFICYYYKPTSFHSRFIHDNGIKITTSLFGGTKLKNTNVISFRPHPDTKWDVYYNEIVKLGQSDGIEIRSVLYDNIKNALISDYPITTQCKDGRFVFAELRLFCTIKF